MTGTHNRRRVLTLYTRNSCRSQMAEGWVNHVSGEQWDAHSARTSPAVTGHQLAMCVMPKIGVDISGARPMHVNEYVSEEWDLVATVCDSAREACSIFPRPVKQIHISFPHPAVATGSESDHLAVFRQVRDQIRDQVLAAIGA
jgi:arsenate reductase